MAKRIFIPMSWTDCRGITIRGWKRYVQEYWGHQWCTLCAFLASSLFPHYSMPLRLLPSNPCLGFKPLATSLLMSPHFYLFFNFSFNSFLLFSLLVLLSFSSFFPRYPSSPLFFFDPLPWLFFLPCSHSQPSLFPFTVTWCDSHPSTHGPLFNCLLYVV